MTRRRLLSLALALASAAAAQPDAAHWPRWRGPFNNGVARTAAPVEWSQTKNLAWKTAIPGRGHSTPIIWGDRIYLTTAVPTGRGTKTPVPLGGGKGTGGGAGVGEEQRFVVLCLDRKTGQVIWERTAKVATPHEGYHYRYGSFASNSPVTDGQRVYAFFGSRGIYCYDLNGKLVWQKDFPPMLMRLHYGEGTAAVLDGDRLILNFDQETDSYIVALSKMDGRELWRASRDEPSAWAQPLVLEHHGKRQVVVAASNKVRSYDYQTGNLVWQCGGLGANVIPSPVTAGGIVYAMSGHRNPNLLAIRLAHTGDLAGSDSVVWTHQRGTPYSTSPVLHENKLYFVTDNGMLTCLNAQTGQPYYLQQRLPKPYNFKASPVGAGGKLYLATEEGDVVVVKMGEKYEVLATNSLGDQTFIASPVVAEERLYLRSQEALYSIK
jgi:outer membrane protein assembly factor BamB